PPPPGLFRGQSYFDEGVNFFPPTGVNLHRLFHQIDKQQDTKVAKQTTFLKIWYRPSIRFPL
ncbi:hypothetical protein, partial [Bacteroides faecichinchillae]|uniref:hypothetical protein n=1 Tax=Bacteroides faecichinchillae TaxID=871325 RepID=UPI001C3175A9